MTRIAVCGAGTMGAGIAETSARSGYPTLVFDPHAEALEKARTGIVKNLQVLYEKGKIQHQDQEQTLSRLTFSSNVNDCIADVIIEAIIEDITIKGKLYQNLVSINTSEAIIASNTSSLSIDILAQQITNPERFCGMHFFNPAPLMKLVELVYGSQTSSDTIQQLRWLATSMGKAPVVCKDSPGFIVNRVARHYYLEALQLVEDNVASIEQVDRILENAGFKMGPFKLMDLIGNDINHTVTKSLYEALGRPARLKPSVLQEEKIRKGELGRKTGKGFYGY